MLALDIEELRLACRGAHRPWSAGEGMTPVVSVDLDGATTEPGDEALLHGGLGAIVVGLGSEEDAHPLCDLVVGEADIVARIESTAAANPIASGALVRLLRGATRRSIDDGLVAESAAYSTLQAGPEFARWRASRPARPRVPEDHAVVLDRDGDTLTVTLDRPHVRNALNATMRDELVEAFALVALDASITDVHVRGAGDAFCVGGDLDEFGTFGDPATAHLVRLQQSVGRGIAAVARVTAHLHGGCVGSGIELPAFAGRVVATRDTFVQLPELSLGLVPGAGGTVSLPRRIGRHRTARMALTGERIDAATACDWGLVDEIC